MSDQKTREAIAEVLKGECPIVAAYAAAGKDLRCRYFGFSEGCTTCTYPWEAIAEDATKEMDRRLANWEVEKKRRIVAEGRLDDLLAGVTKLLDPFWGEINEHRTQLSLGSIEVDENGDVRVPESIDGGGFPREGSG